MRKKVSKEGSEKTGREPRPGEPDDDGRRRAELEETLRRLNRWSSGGGGRR
ncbi:hypothetical protein T261_4558 [Streptomyces lydicus]|nr:hypothetical protein T261_4558 [Streptomyces lydicus]